MTTTTQPQPSIQGDYNQISILYQLTQARPEDFFRPNLDDYRMPLFPQLSLTGKLIGQLRRDRILLLTGELAIDTHEIARYLAGYLCDLLGREAANGNGRVVEYQEWSGLNGHHIDSILEQYTEPTIFILPKLHPQHINYNYQKLRCALGSNHYVIVSIDYAHPWQQWASEEPALASSLQRLTFAETYPSRILADFFESFVGEAQIDPGRFRTDTDGRPRIGSQSIEQIAAQLQTPRRVREFVRQLSALPLGGLFTAEHVTEAQKSTHGGNTLRSWYQHLDEQRHHHLLALALYLFDGLAEKQFFAAVDMAIAQAWRQRDPWLRSLDYKDLVYLEHFFQFVSTKQGMRALRTRSPEERRMLLDIVWNEQRRSIASTLPVFYDYISQSQKPRITELAKPTYTDLVDHVQRNRVHILHFDGHGSFGRRCRCRIHAPHCDVCPTCRANLVDIPPEGYLAFEDRTHDTHLVPSSILGTILYSCSIQMAVLLACSSGVVHGDTLFTGVGPALVQAGVPAVVATQSTISTDAANVFAETFYQSLVRREPVAMAVNQGRQQILLNHEWFIPILYLRDAL